MIIVSMNLLLAYELGLIDGEHNESWDPVIKIGGKLSSTRKRGGRKVYVVTECDLPDGLKLTFTTFSKAQVAHWAKECVLFATDGLNSITVAANDLL